MSCCACSNRNHKSANTNETYKNCFWNTVTGTDWFVISFGTICKMLLALKQLIKKVHA